MVDNGVEEVVDDEFANFRRKVSEFGVHLEFSVDHVDAAGDEFITSPAEWKEVGEHATLDLVGNEGGDVRFIHDREVVVGTD
jgi:hypothetical protein